MNKVLYSISFAKGRRTYFFDINESSYGDLYLNISETKKVDDDFERHRLMIFEEDMKDFLSGFNSTIEKFKELKTAKANDKKRSSEKAKTDDDKLKVPLVKKNQ
ncbi:MAG: PUR family DNA/RNA-binding protein [Bacteroidales bacterium]|jgi:hypothetical protein|nr:PUR family DNA/RNA-binding protein [Bacteroidales bacterium]